MFQLEERVFEDSSELGDPSHEHSSALGTNGRSVELRARGSGGQSSRSIRRQTWNRDEVSLAFHIQLYLYYTNSVNLAPCPTQCVT